MSSHTYVDVVPYKIETNLWGNDDVLSRTPLGAAILEGREPSEVDHRKTKGFNFAGWKEDPDPDVPVKTGWPWIIGKKQRIYAKPIRKGDLVVYCLNESEYSMVGEYEISFVAERQKDLVEFCVDVGLNVAEIEDHEPVKWTV